MTCLLYTATMAYASIEDVWKRKGTDISDTDYVTALLEDAATVSYTHLDVYKRQLLGEAECTYEQTDEDMENGLGSALRKLYKGRNGERIYAKYKTKRGKCNVKTNSKCK